MRSAARGAGDFGFGFFVIVVARLYVLRCLRWLHVAWQIHVSRIWYDLSWKRTLNLDTNYFVPNHMPTNSYGEIAVLNTHS